MKIGDGFIRRPFTVRYDPTNCVACGYPLEIGDRAYMTSEDDIVCASYCGAALERSYEDRDDAEARRTP